MSTARKRLTQLLWNIEPILADDEAHERRIAEHLKFVNQVQRMGGLNNDRFDQLKRQNGRLIVGYSVVRGTEVSATFYYCPLQYSQRKTYDMAQNHLIRITNKEII